HHTPSQPMPQPQPQPQPHTPPPPRHARPPQPAHPHPGAQPQPRPHAAPHPSPGPQPQPHPHPHPHGDGAPAPGGAGPETGPDAAPAAPSAPAARGTRPRTGSPIIAPGLPSAAVTTVLAALLAVTAPLGQGALTGAVVLLQLLTAAGWYRLNGMWPARQGIALAFVAGLSADAGLLLTDGDRAPAVLLGATGVWCVLSLVLQLRNNSSPDERLYAVTAGFAATGLTVLAAGLVPAEPEAVTLGAAAVAGAALLRAVPLPAVLSLLLALAAAAGAGVGTAQLNGVEPATAALLGLGAGVCALVGLRVASYDWPSRFVHMTAGVALPLTLATPALAVLGGVLL
ncbi:hypothetical protein, partial [Streptomyces albus]|uniref:hypothetical protein n=1 Tax=Streptomyces albus TaxID=1888 RepID=UPI001A9B2904